MSFTVCPRCKSSRIRGDHCPGQQETKDCKLNNCHGASVCDNCELEWTEGCQNPEHKKTREKA